MAKNFSFQITSKDNSSYARSGIIHTARGKIETPCLVPVATRGNILCLTEKDIKNLNIPALLTNTYHLHFKPGDKTIKEMGGVHKFINFNLPIFTDSGGFQAFSLGLGKQTNARKIGFFPNNNALTKKVVESFSNVTENGVYFTSIYDEKIVSFMGPKESMQIQSNIGADIIMAFDECTSASSNKAYIRESMLRSHRWELESLKYHNEKQAIYGIIHGGWYKDLRLESTKFILSHHFDGIAIGGSLGKTKKDMYKILKWISPLFEKDNRPVHMLGIGQIDDIFECVEQGVDTFDCVEMTRLARHNELYVSPKSGGNIKNKFRMKIRRKYFSNQNLPIDSSCTCQTCKNYTRAELHNLYHKMSLKVNKNNIEMKIDYGKKATIHNIYFILDLMRQIRESIKDGTFKELKKEWINK